MSLSLLLLPLIGAAGSSLPPQPVSHLTPPQQSPAVEPTPERLTRWLRNDSSPATVDVKPSESEPHQQEARAIVWAAPAIPILSSHRGRSSDGCNPCERVPWMPMARALNPQQYALSIPTIQLTLPVNYGIPIAEMRPPPQYGPPPLPQQQQGPSAPQHGPPPQYHGPPPPQLYGPPPQHGPAPNHYRAPLIASASGDAKFNAAPQNQYAPPESDKGGLPPPPLPQRFILPSKTYGSPQPQMQFASPTNINPSPQKYLPPPPPPLPNYPFLTSGKYGPLLNAKPPTNYNPSSKPPPNYLPANPPPPHGTRPVNHGPQQYQEQSVKKPVFIQNPIPFPTMSKTQLPPLFDYQTFNDGKQDQLHPYLQPPKPQNVVFTITETDDVCKKCQEKSQASDSEAAQAEHATENVVKTTAKQNNNLVGHQKPDVEMVKSVPLAEYLASVEYPMQIIQAPILDVPDLTKYFDLGYHNFPQVTHQQGSGHNIHDQNPSQSQHGQPQQQSALYVNHNLSNTNRSLYEHTSSTALDNVEVSDGQTETTNSLPHNHKPSVESLGKNQETTEKGFTSSAFLQSTSFHTTPSAKQSQIFHIHKIRPLSQSESTRLTTAEHPTSEGLSTTTGHYVTSQPATEGKIEQQLPYIGNPAPFHEPEHSPSQDHQSAVPAEGSSSSALSNLRFYDPLGPGAISDFTLHSYGRGWGNTPPQPFVTPTASPYRARFAIRPSPVPSKKGKHIHQIIVPYKSNKLTSAVAQEPVNNVGWTPLPPTNQGRKVPTLVNFGDQFPATTALDQVHQFQNIFPTGISDISPNVPLSASASDNLRTQQILPTSNGQPLNLPPHVINQILQLNQQGTPWPSGPEELQQLFVTNFQGLLRGEEDSIDIARLQKNIDNWTAEGYKQNSPSVNFIPVTAIPHIFNSKKIPDEYLTSTEPTAPSVAPQQEVYDHYQHSVDSDHEGAESQKRPVKVHPQAHSKDHAEPVDTKDNIDTLVNDWSLSETKVTTSPTPSTEAYQSTTESTTEVQPSSKAWEKIQVSISPLTNEKVYVVTPVPVTESQHSDADTPQSDTTLSTSVERSYSVITSGKSAEVLEAPSSRSDRSTLDSAPETTE